MSDVTRINKVKDSIKFLEFFDYLKQSGYYKNPEHTIYAETSHKDWENTNFKSFSYYSKFCAVHMGALYDDHKLARDSQLKAARDDIDGMCSIRNPIILFAALHLAACFKKNHGDAGSLNKWAYPIYCYMDDTDMLSNILAGAEDKIDYIIETYDEACRFNHKTNTKLRIQIKGGVGDVSNIIPINPTSFWLQQLIDTSSLTEKEMKKPRINQISSGTTQQCSGFAKEHLFAVNLIDELSEMDLPSLMESLENNIKQEAQSIQLNNISYDSNFTHDNHLSLQSMNNANIKISGIPQYAMQGAQNAIKPFYSNGATYLASNDTDYLAPDTAIIQSIVDLSQIVSVVQDNIVINFKSLMAHYKEAVWFDFFVLVSYDGENWTSLNADFAHNQDYESKDDFFDDEVQIVSEQNNLVRWAIEQRNINTIVEKRGEGVYSVIALDLS